MLTALTVQLEQRGRVIESSRNYALSDPEGVPLGQAVQVGRGRGTHLLKAASNVDRNWPVTVEAGHIRPVIDSEYPWNGRPKPLPW